MKLYVISGLGADFKVLERIQFPADLEVVFINWLIPQRDETFLSYVERMATVIDDSEPFSLLGYSFGGIIVQEIDKMKHAEKVIILGSIKSHHEKSRLIKFGEFSKITKILPQRLFNTKSILMYSVARKFVDPKNPKILDYLQVSDSYYLKWGIDKVSNWKFAENPKVIQIMGDKDIVFPIKYCKPNYIIEGGTHLFPATKYKQVSKILAEIFK